MNRVGKYDDMKEQLIEEIRELKKECNELCAYYIDEQDNSKNRTVQNLRKKVLKDVSSLERGTLRALRSIIYNTEKKKENNSPISITDEELKKRKEFVAQAQEFLQKIKEKVKELEDDSPVETKLLLPADSIETVTDHFTQALKQKQPLIIPHAVQKLIIHPQNLLDFTFLNFGFGDRMVNIACFERAYESRPPFPQESMLFETFLTRLQSPGPADELFRKHYYCQQVEMESNFPGLMEMTGISRTGPHTLCPSLIQSQQVHPPTFFLGAAGIKTSLHYDRSMDHTATTTSTSATSSSMAAATSIRDPGKHNLFLQVSGRRKFILFPPSYYEEFRPCLGTAWPHVSKTTTFLHTIPIDLSKDEQVAYLRANEEDELANVWLQRQEIVLSPGDGLFIPAGWWHCTEILPMTTSSSSSSSSHPKKGVTSSSSAETISAPQTSCAINWWFVTKELEDQLRVYQTALHMTNTATTATNTNTTTTAAASMKRRMTLDEVYEQITVQSTSPTKQQPQPHSIPHTNRTSSILLLGGQDNSESSKEEEEEGQADDDNEEEVVLSASKIDGSYEIQSLLPPLIQPTNIHTTATTSATATAVVVAVSEEILPQPQRHSEVTYGTNHVLPLYPVEATIKYGAPSAFVKKKKNLL